MLNTRVITYVLVVAGSLFVGSQVTLRFGNQAIAQGPPNGLNVTVGNTPLPVTVTNPTVAPSTVSVGNPAALAAANAQALGGTLVAFQFDNTNGGYSVPVGQRLVIEYVSGFCNPETQPGSNPTLYLAPSILVTTGGVQQTYNFSLPMPVVLAPTPLGVSAPFWAQAFGQVAKIYADPGTPVMNIISPCTVRLSGRLVNAP
jgi:hypothetical protein